MNWMIDGANGDLYRAAMNYPRLQSARDEWEIERDLHRPATPQRVRLADARHWIAAGFARVAAAFRTSPQAQAQEKLP